MATPDPEPDPGLPQELWPVVFANTQEAILIADARGVIVDVNPAFTRLTGYERAQAIGNTPRMLKSGYQHAGFYRELWQALRTEGCWQGEILNRARNGSVYPQFLTISSARDAGGAVLHYIAIFYDISFLKEQTDRFRHLALHDVLTGLPNRLALNLTLPQAITRARAQGTQLGVCMIDLDDFKPINDAHGHKAGDDLLRLFAQRLKDALRSTDFVARLGGDEFVVLLRDVAGSDEMHAALRRLGSICEQPFALPGGPNPRVRLSLGWTCYPDDDPNGTDSPELLLRNADMALYVAKADKGGRACRPHRWGHSTREEVLARRPAAIDGYGEASARLLRLGAGGLSEAAQVFVDKFYAALFEQADSRRLLCALSEDEMSRLRQRQGEHLLWLLTPDLDQAGHARRTDYVGRLHGVLGVSAAMLVDAMGVYLHALVEAITALPVRVADRASLVQVINARLKNELKFQVAAIDDVKHVYMQWLSRMSQCALDAGDLASCLDHCV
ncbi:MAG: diguanylate cyclase, partial [Betaproteobacteria bacterium]|nr:diguanylate cyclase [Betaproteobacteria bacterium]